MWATRRTLSPLPDERIHQHAAVFAIIVSSTLILASRPGWILGWNLHCGVQALFGLKCPFCGMTRDFAAILHGRHPALNPCSWVAAATVYVLYPATFLWCGITRRLHLFHQPLAHRCMAIALLSMFVLNNVR